MKTTNHKEIEECEREECNHFMVWNIQGGYSYYRCDNCNFIDGAKTFEEIENRVREEIEKYVPRFKGVHKESGKMIYGAGCYTDTSGRTFIITDGITTPDFHKVESISHDFVMSEKYDPQHKPSV